MGLESTLLNMLCIFCIYPVTNCMNRFIERIIRLINGMNGARPFMLHGAWLMAMGAGPAPGPRGAHPSPGLGLVPPRAQEMQKNAKRMQQNTFPIHGLETRGLWVSSQFCFTTKPCTLCLAGGVSKWSRAWVIATPRSSCPAPGKWGHNQSHVGTHT